jgi:hypothetical protein
MHVKCICLAATSAWLHGGASAVDMVVADSVSWRLILCCGGLWRHGHHATMHAAAMDVMLCAYELAQDKSKDGFFR